MNSHTRREPAGAPSLYLFWLCASFAGSLLLLMTCIWPSMDVFADYHIIACRHFPNAVLNDLREACNGRMDLTLPGGGVWPRSYPYIGSTMTWYYYPFYLLYPHPLSAYISNALLVLLAAFGAKRLLECSYQVLFPILFCNFFILFNFIQDAGTMAPQFLAILWVPLMVRYALRSPAGFPAMAWGAGAFLCAFAAFEAKTIFVYTLPGLALLSAAECYRQCPHIPTLLRKLPLFLPGLLLATALAVLLLTARTVAGHPYISDLTSYADRIGFFSAEYAARVALLLQKYFSQFGSAANFAYHTDYDQPELYGLNVKIYDQLCTAAFWLAGGGLWLGYMRHIGATRSFRQPQAILAIAAMFAGVVTLLLVSSSKPQVNPHHVAAALLFISMSLAIAAQWWWQQNPALTRKLLAVVAASQLAIAGYLSLVEPEPRSIKPTITARAILNNPVISAHALIVCVDWGTYYFYALYGPQDQAVVFAAPLEQSVINRVKQSAAKTGRSLVIVEGPAPDPGIDPAEAFPGTEVVYPPPSAAPAKVRIRADPKIWRQWQEESNNENTTQP